VHALDEVPVPQKAATRKPSVSVRDGALSIELPTGMRRLSDLVTRQLIRACRSLRRRRSPYSRTARPAL